MEEGVIHCPQRCYLGDKGLGIFFRHHLGSKLPPQSDVPIWGVYIIELLEILFTAFYLSMGSHLILSWQEHARTVTLTTIPRYTICNGGCISMT